MNRKTFTVFSGSVLLVLAGGVGYHVYSQQKLAPLVQPQPEVVVPADIALVGDVTDVNFEKVATDGPSRITIMTRDGATYIVSVPSMGLSACAAAAQIADPFQIAPGDILEVRGSQQDDKDITPCTDASHYLRVHRTEEKSKFGLTFTYKKGPDGYVLEENVSQSSIAEPELLYNAVFTNTVVYADFINATEPRDGPETMLIHVYSNVEKLSAEQWADTFSNISNITDPSATSTKTTVAGFEAITYTVNGLHTSDVYVVSVGEFLYLMQGPAKVSNSAIAKDFETFMSSLKILPIEIVNGM